MNAQTPDRAPNRAPGLVATRVAVEGPAGPIVHPLDLAVPAGRMLAIIGESGSGKTMTARALTGLLPRGTRGSGRAEIVAGRDAGGDTGGSTGEGEANGADRTGGAGVGDANGEGASWDLGSESPAQWARVRGRQAVLLLQDPFTSLSPVMRCGEQIGATIRARLRETGRAALGRAELAAEVARRLAEVSLPAEVARRYPSELSGGQRQRVAIAAALAAEPRLLIADEPTTALDASTQGEVLDLLRELQRVHRMSLILISHDLGVVAGRADEVYVMRAGEVVERGEADRVLVDPQHPYTRALLEANPSITEAAGGSKAAGRGEAASEADASAGADHGTPAAPLLEARGVSKSFGRVQALREASVEVRVGEIVAVVGESGSGKS
ncbi:MAG: ABC transporter ATP-binding protein, partial [Leucobacter sp.]|nr:ABC transporter ATP-binding protein [Leucobacter sp.]